MSKSSNYNVHGGKPTESMVQCLSSGAVELLKGLYKATNYKELPFCGKGMNSTSAVSTVEEFCDALSIMVPHSDEIITALNYMKKLPKKSIHHQIQPGHVFMFPQETVKLAKNYTVVVDVMNALSELETHDSRYIDGVSNSTLAGVDSFLKFSKMQETALEVLVELNKKGITPYLRNDNSLGPGILDDLSITEHICENKDDYLNGIKALSKLGWVKENKENDYNLWGSIFCSDYKAVISLGQNKELQELLVGLDKRGLIKNNHCWYITLTRSMTKLDWLAPHHEEALEFIDRYHKLVKENTKLAIKEKRCYKQLVDSDFGMINYDVLLSATKKDKEDFVWVLKNQEKAMKRADEFFKKEKKWFSSRRCEPINYMLKH